jgi:hypothetical protein
MVRCVPHENDTILVLAKVLVGFVISHLFLRTSSTSLLPYSSKKLILDKNANFLESPLLPLPQGKHISLFQ